MALPLKEERLLSHWRCMLACSLVCMSPFQYGMDFGLISGMQAMVGFLKVFGYVDTASPVGYNIASEVQQLISSLMVLGAFVGSLGAGPTAVKMGRKQCLWIACLLCSAGNGIMLGTTTLAGLYTGRILIGLANGFFITFSQLYIQECAPARFRGLSIVFFQVWASLGTLVGTVVDNFTSPILSRASYMIPLGLIFIIPLILALGMVFIPESPRWLLSRGETDRARNALLWLRPNQSIEAEFAEMQIAAGTEKQKSFAVLDMWRNPVDRRRTLLAIGVAGIQAACGAIFILAYGTYFFEMANIGNPFMNSCILVAVGNAAILIEMAIVTPYGYRRVFLTTGLIVCGFCQLISAVVYTKQPGTIVTGRLVVTFSVIYTFVYNGVVGPFSWLSAGELPSQRLRSYTFGLATGVVFLGSWLTTFTAPYFINPSALNWGPKYGYIWFPSCLFAATFVYLYIPEVKDRTLGEINEMFEARLPARKFRGYQCTITSDHATTTTTTQEDERGFKNNVGTIDVEKPTMVSTDTMLS